MSYHQHGYKQKYKLTRYERKDQNNGSANGSAIGGDQSHKVRKIALVVVAVVVVYFILSRLLYLAFSANLGLLCMPHPGMGPLV